MQLPEMIKRYRANKGITQKELAQQLGTPTITVARIEQGTSVRLEAEPLIMLGDMMEDESLNMLNGIQTIREWFRCVKSLIRSGKVSASQAQAEAGLILQERFDRENVPEKLLNIFESIGFKRIAGLYKSGNIASEADAGQIFRTNAEFDLVLKNERTGKVWAIDFGWSFWPPFNALAEAHILSILQSNIGRSCFCNYTINKYSLITNISAITEYIEQNPIVPGNIQYDTSVIYYDPVKLQMRTERYLTFYTDGRGLFDLDIEGKSDAHVLEDYAKWTLMFDKQP